MITGAFPYRLPNPVLLIFVRQRMVKSRQKKLNERWGVETSAKGTRFKLNRDMAGEYRRLGAM